MCSNPVGPVGLTGPAGPGQARPGRAGPGRARLGRAGPGRAGPGHLDGPGDLQSLANLAKVYKLKRGLVTNLVNYLAGLVNSPPGLKNSQPGLKNSLNSPQQAGNVYASNQKTSVLQGPGEPEPHLGFQYMHVFVILFF
jgi:hypothetical protein